MTVKTERGDVTFSDERAYHKISKDAAGNVTYDPWTIREFDDSKTLPSQGTKVEKFEIPIPAGAQSLEVEATLFHYIPSPEATPIRVRSISKRVQLR
ncbi:MAG: hypothetical protein HY652_08770 [Acidobacteria bacterium]|nr:hypothetical protein [Acidobacteriota bacterium]